MRFKGSARKMDQMILLDRVKQMHKDIRGILEDIENKFPALEEFRSARRASRGHTGLDLALEKPSWLSPAEMEPHAWPDQLPRALLSKCGVASQSYQKSGDNKAELSEARALWEP